MQSCDIVMVWLERYPYSYPIRPPTFPSLILGNRWREEYIKKAKANRYNPHIQFPSEEKLHI